MRNPIVRSVGAAAILLVMGVAAADPQAASAPVPPSTTTAPPPAPPDQGIRRYVDPTNGWSIDYPVGWRIAAKNPASVKMQDPANQAMLNIHVVHTALPLDAAVDQILATQEQVHRQKGHDWTLVNRQPSLLPDGTPAVDVLVDVAPAGRARQLYVVSEGRAFALNAETYATSWDAYSPIFDQMLNSFRPA